MILVNSRNNFFYALKALRVMKEDGGGEKSINTSTTSTKGMLYSLLKSNLCKLSPIVSARNRKEDVRVERDKEGREEKIE